MKYLDERIIANVTLKSPSLGDRLYRYDVAINNEWDSPIFIGNCFIGANVSTKAIDITDIVRNYYDFSYPYQDTDFQAEWQVRIWLNKDNPEYIYSDRIGIFPIYRYPNRKARMETPLNDNVLNWYIPSLQGFNSDKKGEFLPHIPFVYSDKVDYNLAVNMGNLRDVNPYLHTGVKKVLQSADFGIYNTQYKFSELWNSEKTIDIIPSVTYDSIYFSMGDDKFYQYIKINNLYPDGKNTRIVMRIDNLPLFISKIEYYLMNSENSVIQDVQYTTVQGFWQRHCNIEINDTVTADTQRNYFDLYLYYGENGDNTFINPYPTLITPFESANVNVRIFLNEKFLDYGTDLVEIPEGATLSNNIITFSDLTSGPYNIHLQDSNGNNLQSIQSYGNFRMNLNPYENASKIVISDSINDNPLKTINIVDTAAFNGLNTIALIWSITSNGTTLQINKNGWEGWIYFDISAKGKPEEVKPTTPTLNVEEYNPNGYYYNYQTIVPEKGFIDFSNSDGYDSYSDNTIKLPFTKEDIDNSGYAGTEKTTIFIQNKLNNDTPNYKKTDLYVGTKIIDGFGAFRARDLKILIYVYNDNCDDYSSKIEINFNMDDYIYGFEFTVNGYDFTITKLMTAKSDNVYTSFPVAEIDYCPARYYLQWRDRYGSMQMQPFSKAETYSEDFTRTEIKNYQDTRRLSGIDIQPKWKLNSAWIPFDLVPYYESLQVSPWVKLYDTKEDQLYDVILKDTAFTEKTFRNNDRQLWHLEVECEQTDKQNILY